MLFKRRTVLVLGAGASHDFGFPLGRGLLTKVCQQLRTASPSAAVLSQLGFPEDEQRRFADELDGCGLQSVDAFLENRGKEFMDIGKAAIAAELIPVENHKALMSRDRELWYEFFYSTPLSGGTIRAGILSVITFNYDRSFETYLHTAIKKSFGHDDDQAWAKLAGIPIVHVYGQLGQLTGATRARPYSPELNAESVKVATQGIKIMHEGEEDSDEFSRARALLQEAEEIAFLGFGYHEMNTSRLRTRQLGERRLHGTAFELGQARLNLALLQFEVGKIDLHNMSVRDFLLQQPFWS